jgi:hypothetical protein
MDTIRLEVTDNTLSMNFDKVTVAVLTTALISPIDLIRDGVKVDTTDRSIYLAGV